MREELKDEYNTTTTIEITVHNWTRLNSLKRPGESFNTVVHRLLDEKGKSR